jgi:SAM-dependent methyltransferase
MQFCKLADSTDWQRPDFQATESVLLLNGCRNRKAWEFIQVYNGLNHLGLLHGEAKALGLGVGHECLIYAFSNLCQRVVATDLYNSENWSTASMSTDEVYHKNPFPYPADRLVVQHMDMTQIEFPDASFDFIWSCCAIEHVNTFEDLHRVYQEIHRVLKPGGIAALTTEYNTTDWHSYEPNMLFTDRYWIEHWLTGNHPLIQGFELLDLPDLSLTAVPENEPQYRRYPEASIQVYTKDVILNSISFFLRKTEEFSQPYCDDWLPQSVNLYLNACQQQRTKQFQKAESLLKQLLDDEAIELRLRVAALQRLIVCLRGQNKAAEALQYCQIAVPLGNEATDSDRLLPLANQCKKSGLWDDAKHLYQRVETLPGADMKQVIRSIIGQAECAAHENNLLQALALVDRAHQYLAPEHMDEAANIYFHQGFYNEQLGNLDLAIQTYQLAIEASMPDSNLQKNAQLRRGQCLQVQRDRVDSQAVQTKSRSDRRLALNAVGNVVKNLFKSDP